MKITIFGKGVVGAATGHAFSIRKDHEVEFIDPPKGISGSVNADLILICVPTPFSAAYEIGFDTSALTAALNTCPGGSCVVIKSTVPPGTTELFQRGYPDLDLFFSPEFLTEKTRYQDAMYPARQIVGYAGPGDGHRAAMAHELVLPALPYAPWEWVTLATEAEIVKYFSNAFYAVKVAFANQMYDLCEALKEQGVDYDDVREAAEYDPMIAPCHLDVHHGGYRGFSGKCLPKDLDTLIHTMRRLDVDQDDSLMRAARDYNNQLRRLREMHGPFIQSQKGKEHGR